MPKGPSLQALHPTPKGRAFLPALIAALLLPTAAFASEGGGPVSPAVYEFMVFVIAIFVGYYVVWSVTPALHTPLMAVTNAISSVIIVGALIAAAGHGMGKWLGLAAVALASVNIFGGFLVTRRMLEMFKKKDRPAAGGHK